MKEIKIYNTLKVVAASNETEFLVDAMSYADEIAEAVAEYDDGDLAEYADARNGDSYYKKLKRNQVSVEIYNHELYGVAICTVTDDWNEIDTEQLKSYLTGQWADGFGEGLEQQDVAAFTELESYEEYDEENDEFYESECEVSYYVTVSFWQDKNYRLLTEEELKG